MSHHVFDCWRSASLRPPFAQSPFGLGIVRTSPALLSPLSPAFCGCDQSTISSFRIDLNCSARPGLPEGTTLPNQGSAVAGSTPSERRHEARNTFIVTSRPPPSPLLPALPFRRLAFLLFSIFCFIFSGLERSAWDRLAEGSWWIYPIGS